jgi:transcriptional regulator with XRE-family HTH domain
MARDSQDEERQRQFARNLRAARERAGLTQAGIAAKLGMEDEVYARYERARMWPSLDRLCRLCDILGCTSDSLLGTDQPPPRPARPPALAPDDDSPDVRRLLRRLRKARPRTVRLARQMIDELDKYDWPTPGGARAQIAPGNDDDVSAGTSSGDDATAAAGASPGNDGDTGEP